MDPYVMLSIPTPLKRFKQRVDDRIEVVSRAHLANVKTVSEDHCSVQVRHDKNLSKGSGDVENGQIKKVLSGKSLQVSKTDWVANLL